jgi:glycosyltransferase involved in cell wall biosynthesis
VHVLALNWRDLANPRAGGAEVHMEEILRHLGHQGHRCTLLTSGFPGGAAEEHADGYRIVRGGHEYDFNVAVPFLYHRVARHDPPDVVLDDINKIPFYSPLWTRVPVLAVVPHLMGTSVFREVNPFVATAVYAAEWPVRRVYRRCHFEVISQSTKDELVARGWEPERVTVVHCGIDRTLYRPDPNVAKNATPTILYVGRVKRYKSVDHAIRAMPLVRRAVPNATLVVVGDGDKVAELRRLVDAERLQDAVRFTGYVPLAEKRRLVQAAHVVVNPSMKEGWGLTNVEANACGTTCVAADSPGLRDSVRDGESGLLYPYGDVPALAAALVRVLQDHALRTRLERGGLTWADQLTWAHCGDDTLALVERVVRTARPG